MGLPILIIAPASLLFAFLLYTEVWLITNNNILTIETQLGIQQDNSGGGFNGAISNLNFWFGYIILCFPLALYLLVFWAYATMLYNARLAEIIKALKRGQILSLFKRNKKGFEAIFEKEVSITLGPPAGASFSLPTFYEGHFTSSSQVTSAYISSRIRKRTYKWKSSIITDLVKKISLRVDGTTPSGYFFALVLLLVLVTVSFVPTGSADRSPAYD